MSGQYSFTFQVVMTRNVDLITEISFTRYDAKFSKGMDRQQWNQNMNPFFFLIKWFDGTSVEFLFGETGWILAFVVKSSKSINESDHDLQESETGIGVTFEN